MASQLRRSLLIPSLSRTALCGRGLRGLREPEDPVPHEAAGRRSVGRRRRGVRGADFEELVMDLESGGAAWSGGFFS